MAEITPEKVAEFQSVAGEKVTEERARFFLESAGGDLSKALSSFFETSAPGADASVEQGESSGDAQPPANPSHLNFAEAFSESDEDSDEGQAFYAGGSRASGQQVLGPNKKKNPAAKLFRAAKEHGAEVVNEFGNVKKTTKRQAFAGTSYRLGETNDDTEVFQDPNAQNSEQEVQVRLTMWSNGFSLDDGPLRQYDDPQNARFLAQIKAGVVPTELIAKAKGKEISFLMSDRHHDDYVPPKRTMKAFSGSGQSLGSPAPTVVGQVSHVPGPGGSAQKPPPPSSAVGGGDPKAQEEAAKATLALDAAQPATNVQIRLGDGSRLVIRLNHTHTVGDIRTYIATARPVYSSTEFALMTTFPHAELSDMSATVKDANLLNSALVAKFK